MGQRSRKRRRTSEGAAPARPAGAAYARSRARNDEARAELEPLAPGERPVPVLVGAAVAAALGIANFAAFAAGTKIGGKTPSAPGVLAFTALMLTAAVGMWRLRYWAVLGFQALLALIILVFALLLITASNVAAVAVCVAVIGPGGWLFWKLIRSMARIQMPERRPSSR